MANRLKRSTRTLGLTLLLAGLVAGVAVGVAPAQSDQRSCGEPRAEATEGDRKIFAYGLQQFSRSWDEHDGVGERFNEHSCVGGHSGPMPGGSGSGGDTFFTGSEGS